MLAEPITHDLSHSSQPTGSEPTFQPVAAGRAKTSDEALVRLADEIADLARREREAYSALGDLSAADGREAALTAEAKALEETIMDRFMMQSLIWADTPLGLAAKGRALLAYRETLENCQTPELQPMLLSMASDAVRFAEAAAGSPSAILAMGCVEKGSHNPDSALLTIGRHFEQQWRQERIVIARNGSDEAIKIETDRSEDFVNRIRDLPATTPAGWHVKARAIAWTCGSDVSGECPVDVKVVASLLRDLGAIEGGGRSTPTLPDPDRYLLKFKRPFDEAWAIERAAAAALDGSGGKAAKAYDQAFDALAAVVRQIESFPATSIEGLKLKAAALSSLHPEDEITSEVITGVPDRNATDIRLIVQIIRDLRAMVDEPSITPSAQPAVPTASLEKAA